MKIHDFGLWFHYYRDGKSLWSTEIPQHPSYMINYDGEWLGAKSPNGLNIYNDEVDKFIIKLKNTSARRLPDRFSGINAYEIDTLSLNDFEIIPNPNYKDTQ